MKSGSLNLLQSSGPVQACDGIALPLPLKPSVVKFQVGFKSVMFQSDDMHFVWGLDICEKCCIWWRPVSWPTAEKHSRFIPNH